MNSFYSKTPYIPPRQNYSKTESKKEISTRQQSQDAMFNVPSIPLLFNMSPSKTAQNVLRAIKDEATTIDFYSRLLEVAPDDFSRDFITDIIDEEKQHLAMFTELYVFLTGNTPAYTITPINFSSFKEGIFKALMGELDAMDFYKQMVVSTTDELVQQAFYFAQGDETEHAIMFNTIYSHYAQ